MLGNLCKAFLACGSGFLRAARRSPSNSSYAIFVREYASLADSCQGGVLSSKKRKMRECPYEPLVGDCRSRTYIHARMA